MTSSNRKLTDFFTITSSPSMSPSPRPTAGRTPINLRDRKSFPTPSSQKSHLGLQSKPRPSTCPGTSSAPIEVSSTDADTSIEVLAVPTSKEAPTTRQNKTVAGGGVGSKSHPVVLADTSSESASPMPGTTLKNTPIPISSDSDVGLASSHSKPPSFTTKHRVEEMDIDNASSQDENEVHLSLSPFKDNSRTVSSTLRSTVKHETMDWEPTPSPPSSPPHRSPVKHRSFLPTPEKTSPDTSAVGIRDVLHNSIATTRSSQTLSTPPSSSVSPTQAPVAHDTPRDKSTQDTTARIIARIKAEAKARVLSEEENEEILLSSVPVIDTSDDDELDTLDLALGFSMNTKPKARRPSPPADVRAHAARTLITSSSLTSSSDGEEMDADCSSPSESGRSNPRRSARAAERASRTSRSSSPDPLMLGPSILRPFDRNNGYARGKPSAFEQLLLEETRKRKKAGGVQGSLLAAKLADEAFKNESDSDSELFMAKRPSYGNGGASHRVVDKGNGTATASRGDILSAPHRRRGRSRIVDSDVENNSASVDTDTGSDSGSDNEDNEARKQDERQQSTAKKFLGSDTERLRNILTSDTAVRRKLAISTTGGSFRFWMKTSKVIQQAKKDDIPRREAPTDPLIRGLRDAVKNNHSLEVTTLLGRWETYPGKSDPSTARSFVAVLLDTVISTADPMCRSVVTHCLLSLINDDLYTPSDLGLEFEEIVIEAFGKLGAKQDALEVLQSVGAHRPQEVILPVPLVIRKHHRLHATLDLFNILGSLVVRHAVAKLPDLVLLVLLVASHHSSPPEVGRHVSVYINEWLEVESVPFFVQWEICQNIVRATSGWPVRQKFSILESIPQSSASTSRLLSWTAYGMLIPREVEKATLERYIDPPPLSRLLEHLFDKSTSEEGMGSGESIERKRLFDLEDTDKPPNYVDIMYQTDILSNMLCDVRAVVEYEHKQWLARASSSSGANTGGLSVSPSKAKALQMMPLEILCKGLESKHDLIVDTRAADMDRTKAKDAIQRLRMRLLYQRRSALEVIAHRDGTAARGRLEAHFAQASTARASSPSRHA